MKGVQCYELFGGIALKIHTFFHFHFSSLLVARQGDVSRKLNQVFPLVDSFNFNFVDEERSDI